MLVFPQDDREPKLLELRVLDYRVYYINLITKQKLFSIDSCSILIECLNYIRQQIKNKKNCALLISNNGNIFSNGMDVMAIIGGKDAQLTSLERYYQLLSNLLTFPVPTISVVQGHSFAAGFTFTLCFDYIFMRSEHGYLCMNEVDMPAAIPPGLVELIKQKVRDPVIAKKIILQGHRFTGKEAKQAGLVDDIKPKGSLLDYGFEFAKAIAKNNKNDSNYSNLRAELYSEVVKQLSHFNPGYLTTIPMPKL